MVIEKVGRILSQIFRIQVQINGFWYNKSQNQNERIALLRTMDYVKSTGQKHRIIDSQGRLIDLINP